MSNVCFSVVFYLFLPLPKLCTLPRCQVPVDEPPLLQISHATSHLHSILTQSVDQHWALRTNAAQTLQQRTERCQFSHLQHAGEKKK